MYLSLNKERIQEQYRNSEEDSSGTSRLARLDSNSQAIVILLYVNKRVEMRCSSAVCLFQRV
jgi:hypothetical protein